MSGVLADPLTALAGNAAVSLAILGVGAACFVRVNGSPRSWRSFPAREPNPAVRVHRWRKRMQGYFAVSGATVGSGVASGGFLVTRQPNVLGQIVAFDFGLSAAGMGLGLLAGLSLGAVAAVTLQIAPEPPDPDND